MKIPKIITRDSLLEASRQRTYKAELPFLLDGKQYTVEKDIAAGEMAIIELEKPLGEMISTADTLQELLRKVVLDVELGRENVPLLYKDIYSNVTDRNLPKIIDAKVAYWGTVVFFEYVEGTEIKFGKLESGEGPTARLTTYAAGFEYTEDMVEWNETFNMEILNKSMGEAYNALLNHVHLNPIFNHNYGADNKTAADTTGDNYTIKMQNTLKNAIKAAREQGRSGNILLAHSSREFDLKEGFKDIVVNATPYTGAEGIDKIIFYDGWSVNVGKKSYTYDGVPTNKAYLIRPKRGFIEYVKHDLLVDATTPQDLSRLIEKQIVGRARRGALAFLDENVQEITLP